MFNYITLNQLTKTVKGLVNKINSELTIINNKLGNLLDLNTNIKTNMVAAINEIAATQTNYDDTALSNRITALENAGYITSYTETDPTVPAWAKQANKPTYTAAEVGALPDTTVIPAAQVQSDWNATSGMGVILNKPTIPAATTVTNTLASGTLIATINGTNIYAPAYADADGVSY